MAEAKPHLVSEDLEVELWLPAEDVMLKTSDGEELSFRDLTDEQAEELVFAFAQWLIERRRMALMH